MAQPDTVFSDARRNAGRRLPREAWLLVFALVAGAVGLVLRDAAGTLLMASIAGSFCALAILLMLGRQRGPLYRMWLRRRLVHVLGQDGVATIAADAGGRICFRNRVARKQMGTRADTVAETLAASFADPAAIIARLQARAAARGAASEDLLTGRGRTQVSVHRIGRHGFVWRIEDRGGEACDVTGLPQATLSRSGAVIDMSPALRALTGDGLRGLDQIVTDLPLRPGEEHELITRSGPQRCFVAETQGTGERRVITFLPVAADKAASHDPTAFETLPIPLMRLASDGRVLAVNAAARALVGEVENGRSLADLFEGLGRQVGDWVADARSGRAEKRAEVMRLRGRQAELFLQVTLNRVVEEGRAGFIAVLSDATQFKTLEAQFVQAQKMQAIGQLAGGVAHDFNNLLTAISGHCDLLMLRHDRGDPDYADLEQISQNANRAAALVRQLLAFSRKQTLNPQVIDLRDTLSDLTHLLNRLVGEKVVLMLSHDPDLRPIRADKRQLEQVIMNLVVNARDAMPGGGEIRIETENLRLEEDFVRDRATVPRGDYVRVRVTDEGTGIPEETLSKIFEPFFTTKRTGEGTGLGLSTAYGIVKQTGGYIFCESELGRGTTFTILLPTHDRLEAPPPEPVAAPAPLAEDTPATILLVEDEAPVRAFAARALKLRGYTVFEAENAEEALEILADPALRFDIFVTDVIMPGMDGPTWVAEALKQHPDTAVVFMSGYAEDAFRNGMPQIANSAFLPKPFSLSELAATVQNTLGR